MTQLQDLLAQGWLPYVLALLAAGLLPVKSRAAYRGTALALALLWGLVAYVSWIGRPPVPPAWTWLSAAEALLFLLAAASGRLKLEARKGTWALAGALMILYSLLVFPLLGLFLGFSPFRLSALGFPFPPVVFTCGVLFFAVDWPVDLLLLLLLPLGWALFGGPDASPGVAELAALSVSLLAAALFAVLPAELRGGGDNRTVQVTAYRLGYHRRAQFGYGLWLLILVTVLVFLLQELTGKLPPALPVNLALLSAFGIVLWMIFRAWLSLWYRYAAWSAARVGGWVWGWARDAWRWIVFLLGAAALIVWLCQLKAKTKVENWPLEIFVAAILLWLIYQAYLGRKRLVISAFAVHTGDDKVAKWATGLASRLEDQLAKIGGVYKVIDEARPSQKVRVVEVGPEVQDVGDILKQASALDLGVKIPTKFLLSMVGFMVSGPRLTGSLHKVEDDLILLAEINGGGRSGNWRVDRSELDEEERNLPEEAVVDKLIEKLGFRITTDLVTIGSPRWRAVRCFTDGLRAFREAERQGEKSQKLREAESCLIKALQDDQKFSQCHYNLGVVYRRLGELGSAESAFHRVFLDSPDNFDACYALAETLIQHEKYREAYWFSKAAIGINAGNAQAWDLAAFARRFQEEKRQKDDPGRPLPPRHPAWNEIREMSGRGRGGRSSSRTPWPIGGGPICRSWSASPRSSSTRSPPERGVTFGRRPPREPWRRRSRSSKSGSFSSRSRRSSTASSPRRLSSAPKP
jgi:hypothetical protein